MSTFKKTIKEVDKLLFVNRANPAFLGDVVFNIARDIARDARFTYLTAQYSGEKDVSVRFEPILDMNPLLTATDYSYKETGIEGSNFVILKKYVSGHHKYRANYVLGYKVIATGKSVAYLEFGSGERFEPTEYGSKVGATQWGDSDRSKHFISTITGKETWVYKGEEGNNPYYDGKVSGKENAYYSSGNKPCRALFEATQRARKNLKQYIKEATIYK